MHNRAHIALRKTWKFLVNHRALVPIFFAILLIGFYLLYSVVNGVRIRTNEQIYEQEVKRLQDQFNEYGLPVGTELSEEPEFETKELVVFKDRVVEKVQIDNNTATDYGVMISGLEKAFGSEVKISVLPIPCRAVFEPAVIQYKDEYLDYVASLKNNLTGNVELCDCYDLMDSNDGRKYFYRTDRGWTAQGAYFGYAAVCDSLGIDGYEQDYFTSHMEKEFSGSFYEEASEDDDVNDRVEDYVDENVPKEPFYYCLAKNAKNYELVKSSRDEQLWKRPMVLTSEDGTTAIVGYYIEYAIVPGNGEGDLLLISDESGKKLVPYLVENYKTVIVFDIRKYGGEDYKEILDGYDIENILVAQDFHRMGIKSYSRFLNKIAEN